MVEKNSGLVRISKNLAFGTPYYMFKPVICFSRDVAIWIQKAEANPTIFLKGCETSLRGGDKNFTASYNSHKNSELNKDALAKNPC